MYKIKFNWGTFLHSHCCAIMTTDDIKQASIFKNKHKIRSFEIYWGYKRDIHFQIIKDNTER